MAATATTRRNQPAQMLPAFLRDTRVLAVLGQLVFVILVVAFFSLVGSAILNSLAAKNLTPNLNFLTDRAGFDISEFSIPYSSDSNYGTAFVVGLINTLRIVVLGLITTTILGILGGIFLLSNNWLLSNITRALVEVLRNTPLIVQLFVWYFIIMFSLPEFRRALSFPNEGVTFIPLVRLGLYLVLWLVIWSNTRLLPRDHWRRLLRPALLAGIFAAEFALWLAAAQPVWRELAGLGSLFDLRFLAYTAISLGLAAAVWRFAPAALRGLALAVLLGQFGGGLAFYFGLLPQGALRLEIYPALLLSVRGIVFPEVLFTAHFGAWMAFVSVGVALAIVLWIIFGARTEDTGRQYPRVQYALLSILGFAAAGWLILSLAQPTPQSVPVTLEDGTSAFLPLAEARAQGLLTREDELFYSSLPLEIRLPEQGINRAGIITGLNAGTSVSPEYMALLLGLVIYTAAFIAEIVRAGIRAVPKGQIEAARALGLTTGQVLSIIVLPQALRVIIPPLGNQYLNLAKNSSLAIAIAYADLYAVTQTIMNQSGQSITGMTMVMLTYLAMSLTIAFVTNLANRRFQLVTR